MTRRVCLEHGCPTLTDRTRCGPHERDRDRARGTRQQRGYDAEHDRVGVEYQRQLDAGQRFDCWRCHMPLTGTVRGRDWMLGHCDADRAKHHGPEHPRCNLATTGRTGCPHASHGP